MPAPFFIVGPTAVGKSGLAAKVASRCGAELIGADAFQVYRGFDVLTAKPSLEERALVPHHLIGTVPPAESYNVARFLDDAQHVIAAVSSRGNPVLVVGGTGLYVKALTHGLSLLPEADPAIRAELDPLDAPTLVARLRALDPVATQTIDVHNKRRLIRALEVCLLTGQPFSLHQNGWNQQSPSPQPNGVFLVRSKEDVDARVRRRVAGMFSAGVVEEVQAAVSMPLSPTASRMIGLREIEAHLSNRRTLEECREDICVATRQYAKRQVTWFQRERHFERFDLSQCEDESAHIDWLSRRFVAYLDRVE